jgi:long-chain acyl-CoA synthetase
LEPYGHEVSYQELIRAVEWNSVVFRKLGYGTGGRGQPVIALNVLLGWRAVPILLAALLQRITVVPVDTFRNPGLTGQILSTARPELMLDTQHTDEQGRLRLGLIPGIFPRSLPELEDVALIMYTSGTSGFPKGVMLTYANLWSNLSDILGYFDIGAGDRLLLVRPLTHASAITGELLPGLYNGSPIVIKPNDATPLSAIREIVERRISVLCTTPTVAAALARIAFRHDVSGLRRIILSGEMLLETPLSKIREAFPETAIGNAYGLTEAAPRISCLTDLSEGSGLQSVGKPLRSVRLKIADESGETAVEGSRGVLWISGPNIMKGYFRDDTATAGKLKDGWLVTSDLASFHEGELFVHGRADDVFIRGGINIHPLEIESYLLEIDGISEALVFARQEDKGTRISAWVVAAPELDRHDIYKRVLSHQPDSRLWPDVIEVKTSLPKTPSGKLLRPKQ